MTAIDIMASGLVLGVLAITIAKAISIKKPEKTGPMHLTLRMGVDEFAVIEQDMHGGTLKLVGPVFENSQPGHFVYIEQFGFDRVELVVLSKAVLFDEFVVRCRGVKRD